MYLDFQGDISLEQVRTFLKADNSNESRAVLEKLVRDKGVDELLITLADCLKDHIRTGVSDEIVREQINLYSES